MSDGVCHLCIDEIVVVAKEVSKTNQSIALCVVKACYCQSCCEKRAVPEAWVHLRTLWPRCRASAAGAKGCVGRWAAVGWGTWSSCLAPQHQPPRPFLRSLLCLVQLWGERAFIYCALHFSLSAGWQSVFLLPEPRQAVFFCAQLQGVTPLFPTLTSKAAV